MLKDNSGTGKVFRNASWLIACRIVQALLSFVIGTLTARYLGPSGYGVIDYANAIVSFMVPVVQLGIRSTLVHEIISAPEREGQVLGTSLCMSAGASLLGIAGVAAFAGIANRGEKKTVIVCVLYSISLLFQATEMLQYWFQAKLMSKYVAVTSLIAYAAVSAYRCFLLVTGKNVYWFALSQALDLMLISVCLYFLYRRLSGQHLSVSMPLAGAILRRSRYYILSGIMVTFFSLTDRVMITLLLGKEANGFYSAAVTCADISRFVFAAIVDSARPAVLEAKKIRLAGLRATHLPSVLGDCVPCTGAGAGADSGSAADCSHPVRKSLRGCGSDSPDYRLEYAVCLRGQRSEHMDTRRTEAAAALEDQSCRCRAEYRGKQPADPADRH